MDKIKEMYEEQKPMQVNRFIKRRYVNLARLIPNGSKVLDIGCKDGSFAEYVDTSCHYFGVDISNTMLEIASKKGVTVVNANITKDKMPFEDKSFDVIIMAEILEHLDSHITALKEVHRLLKPDGKLIITVPNPEGLKKELDSVFGIKKRLKKQVQGEHICAFGMRELLNLLVLCDFFVLRLEKINPEIGSLGILFPDTWLFSPFATNILAIAKVKNVSSE